jgi:hypothetical protein
MDRFGNVLFENKEIANERLELMDKEAHYFLGPDLTMRNCTLVLKVSARRLFFDGARFINCTFEVKQELKNHQQWVAASLKGCRFKGRLSGCDFGHWPEYSSLPGYQLGSIEDCDFTEARLDGCRFHGCDPATLRLPKWPCFTILDPLHRSRELAAMPWPGDIGPIIMEGHAREPPSTVAVTWFAPVLAKEYGTTPEAIKAVVEKCEGLVY